MGVATNRGLRRSEYRLVAPSLGAILLAFATEHALLDATVLRGGGDGAVAGCPSGFGR